MKRDHWLPTPTELDRDPEIALLAVLDHALDVASAAIVSQYPNLLDDEPFSRRLDRPDVQAADVILTRTRRLRDALHRYRRAIAALHSSAGDCRWPPRDTDALPF